MTDEEYRDAVASNVSLFREWLAGQPDIRRVMIEQANGTRIRIGRKRVQAKARDGGGWHDLSDLAPALQGHQQTGGKD